MNFKKNSIALASLLCVTALTGCGKDKGPVTLESMKISGIVTAYMEEETIEWSSLTVTATYSDKSTTTFANSEIEFDVETPAESTKLVVFTSGLHAQTSPYSEGEYNVEAALKASLDTKYSLGTISIGKVTPAKYKLRTFEKPEFVNKYEKAVEDAGKESENAFRKAEELFTVGTLNTFKFAPVATFSKNGVPGQFYVSDNYEKTISLKLVTGENKIDAPSDSYELVKGGINFRDSAAGKTYELSMSPTGFTIGDTTPEVKFTFKVERGLNIYNAKELGALNLTHYTETDFDTEGTTFEEHVGNTRTNSASNVFYNTTTHSYYRPNYKQIWKSFLGQQGTFTQEQLTAYEDVPAIFFQDNIVLNVEDIPSEYFITEEEANMFSAQGREGSFRDDAILYAPIVHDQDVVINGNYFSFNATEIPLCNSTTAMPGMNFAVFPLNYTGQVPPGHASVFKFCGVDPIDSDTYRKAQEDTANGHKGVIKNVSAIGNTSPVNKDQNDKIMEVTGLIFGKNTECGGLYYNNNIKQFQIGLFPDCNVGQPYNHEQVDRTFIDECKVFDCSNTGICNYHNGGAFVTHSEFNRFGGAPVINAGCDDQWAYGITTFGEDVSLKNEITGEEVYFTAVGAASQFGQLKGWDILFTAIGNKFVSSKKINLIALNMDGDGYVASPNKSYYSDVYINKGQDNEVHGGILSTDTNWAVYAGTGYQAPTFSTEYAAQGEIFYYDGSGFVNPILHTEVYPMGSKTMAKLQGKYLNILLPIGSTTLNAIFKLYA